MRDGLFAPGWTQKGAAESSTLKREKNSAAPSTDRPKVLPEKAVRNSIADLAREMIGRFTNF